jgi:hypothetical protein
MAINSGKSNRIAVCRRKIRRSITLRIAHGFAQVAAYAHDAEDAVAFFQIAGRIEIARSRETDIVDS